MTPRNSSSYRIALALAAISLLAFGIVLIGCSGPSGSASSYVGNQISAPYSTAVPTTLTDAPGDQVIATSLTLNSLVLTDSTGKVTTNLLPAAGITYEAAHLDATQEPFFSPALPQDTYVSVSLTYSNAQVTYIDPTSKTINVVAATLANTSQTITFATPITIGSTPTSLLVDYLVAKSVAISGTTVTVTPTFNVTAIVIPPTATTGPQGMITGYKGVVTAVDTTSTTDKDFTLTLPSGVALKIYVNGATVYQGITNFSQLEVNALVEVDTLTVGSGTILPAGSLVATRMEVDDPGTTPMKMLLGPVTAVTGSPATSFNMVVRQQVGSTATTPPTTATVDVTVTGTTNFLLPQRYAVLATALPFVPSFTASTIFAGQHVGVITSGITNNAATATSVLLEPQTIDGTITAVNTVGSWTVYTVTLPSTHWLAVLTGQTTVLVYTNSAVQAINTTSPAIGNTLRFNGYLFDVSGTLRLLTCVQADPPGTPIGPGQI